MKPILILSAISLCLGLAHAQADTTPEMASLGVLKASNESVFTKESTGITFTYFPPAGVVKTSPIYVLEATDEQGHRLRTLGELSDDGLIGDIKAHDGIYGRKFEIYEKKGGFLLLRITDESIVPAIAVSNTLKIEVIRHPRLQELLRTVWKTISARFHSN